MANAKTKSKAIIKRKVVARRWAETIITRETMYRGGDSPYGWSTDAYMVYAFGCLVLQTEQETRANKCYESLIEKAIEAHGKIISRRPLVLSKSRT